MYYRKMFRDLGANKVRYGIIFLVLVIGLMMVVGNVMASCNISDQMDRYADPLQGGIRGVCNADEAER